MQARRFLSHQRTFLDSSPRFTKDAICELERVFHKKPETRAGNLASNLSQAGKELLSVFESELEDARACGITADWWSEGINRKGVTGAEKQAYAVRNTHRLFITFQPHDPLCQGLAWLLLQSRSNYQSPTLSRLPHIGNITSFHISIHTQCSNDSNVCHLAFHLPSSH